MIRRKTSFVLLVLVGITLVAGSKATCQKSDTPKSQSENQNEKTDRSFPRLLHFWVGKWDCYLPKSGKINGYNEITARVSGNAIHEHWTPVGGGASGESWNYYDPPSGTWRQHWMDPQGRPFVYVGKPKDNGILFEGPHLDGKKTQYLQRMFIRPIGNGRVRQTGTKSNDGGKTWQHNFDLIYVPRGEPFDAKTEIPKTDPAKQFDFLIGDWRMDVEKYNPAGDLVSKSTDWSRVRSMIGGASLLDEWGNSGFTVRTWDPRKKVWRLFWTDRQYSAGKMQLWEGTFENSVGTFIGGNSVPKSNDLIYSKIEFSEISDDSVLWKMWKTSDNGKTWVLDYIRRYQRVESVAEKMHSANIQSQNPNQLKQRALQLLTNQQFDDAAKLYRTIVRAEPKNAVAMFRLGYCLHSSGDLDGAIDVYKKTIQLGGKPAAVASYNLACGYSLQEKTDDAFAALEKAIELGFDNVDQLTKDPDLKNLRHDERFSKMIKRITEGD